MSFVHVVCYIAVLGVWVLPDANLAQEVWQTRLVGGTYESEGRVEVFLDNQWGTICDSLWGLEDAAVVCRQLNYTGAHLALVAGRYGEGEGPIVLDKVQCTGSETNLSSCAYASVETSRCDHSRDAGVVCTTQGSLRLVNGGAVGEGRVEILSESGVWGTICDDSWDLPDAGVACRQLGYPEALEALITEGPDGQPAFGPGSGPILLDGLRCSGDELHLRDCPVTKDWGVHDCTHQEDAGMKCQVKSIRLATSTYSDEGGIEVYYGGTWGWVCAHGWTIEDAHVACRQLGFPLGARTIQTMDRGEGPMLLDDLMCTGNESDISECVSSGWANNENCLLDTSSSAGVVCNDPSAVVKLLSGSSSMEGVVEYREVAQSGLVCDTDWSDNEARVVCRQLGYETGTKQKSVTLGSLSGFIFYRDYRCEGNEVQLGECDYVTSYVDICYPELIAQVSCGPPKDYDLRLAGSEFTEQGRVDVFLDGAWNTFSTSYVSYSKRYTLCRHMGYEDVFYNAIASTTFGEGPENVAFESVYCDGGENQLTDCDITRVRRNTTRHPDDVFSMICLPYESVANHPVRLIDEKGRVNTRYGRVEIYHDGQWGSICHYFFPEADMLCRELGYSDTSWAYTLDLEDYGFPQSKGPVWYNMDYCFQLYSFSVTPRNVYQCEHSPWGDPNDDCLGKKIVGAKCVASIPISRVDGYNYDYDDPHSDQGLSAWELLLIVAGIVIPFLIIICCCWRQQRSNPSSSTTANGCATTATYSPAANGDAEVALALEASSPPPAYVPPSPPPTEAPPTYDSVLGPNEGAANADYVHNGAGET